MSCVPCWVLVSLIKRAPPSWGGFFAVLFLRVLDLETSQQRNPPGGGGFFRSTFVVYVLFAAHVSACVLFVFACLVRQRCCMSCTALAHPHPLRQRCRMSCRKVPLSKVPSANRCSSYPRGTTYKDLPPGTYVLYVVRHLSFAACSLPQRLFGAHRVRLSSLLMSFDVLLHVCGRV